VSYHCLSRSTTGWRRLCSPALYVSRVRRRKRKRSAGPAFPAVRLLAEQQEKTAALKSGTLRYRSVTTTCQPGRWRYDQ
jgi:hypothetical protein